MRFVLRIAYKGTHFHGWQKQPNALGVQEAVESALRTLFKAPIEVVGCGRTDTGVHASDYILHFDLQALLMDEKEVIYKLNAIAHDDIAVLDFFQVHDDFHARFDALSRSYVYHLHFRKDPFLRGCSVFMNKQPDVQLMQKAARQLMNYTDFGAFCKSHSDNKTNNCRIDEVHWKQSGHRLSLYITADRFLRNMVRAIVGTLLEVGIGKLSLEDFHEVIKSGNRSEAGTSMPAEGLYLHGVNYNWEKWRVNKVIT